MEGTLEKSAWDYLNLNGDCRVMDLAAGPGPCRLLLEDRLMGRDVESRGRLSQEGRALSTWGQATHGGWHPVPEAGLLCWMPQLLPALCLPEPPASPPLTHTRSFRFSLSIPFQHPCICCRDPSQDGGSDHSTCFSSDFLESSLFFQICMFN